MKTTSEQPVRPRGLAPAAALGAALAVAAAGPVALTLARAAPQAGAPVVVVGPPWASAADLAVRAGGRPIGPLQAPMGVLAVFEDPDFAARLRAAGAWGAFDGARLAALCGVTDDDLL